MPRRNFTGLFIPRAILESTALNSSEKLVLAEIFFLDRGRGCYGTNAHLGAVVGLSKNQVSKIISHLRGAGHIRWEVADNRAGRIMRTNLQNDDVVRAVHDLMRGNTQPNEGNNRNDWDDF